MESQKKIAFLEAHYDLTKAGYSFSAFLCDSLRWQSKESQR